MSTWSAPVRYGECDQQGIVFNSHYLLYADEAMATFCRDRSILDLAERAHVVSSTLTWQAPSRWGDVVAVDARCTRIGTSSFAMQFDMSVNGRACCTVETTYVQAIDGRAVPLNVDVRAALQQQEVS